MTGGLVVGTGVVVGNGLAGVSPLALVQDDAADDAADARANDSTARATASGARVFCLMPV